MDGPCRAYYNAFSAQAAFVEVDIGDIVLYGNGSERTFLLAFAASYAGSLTGLACHCAFFHIDARDKHTASLRAFIPEFYDFLRAGLYARTACSTFLFIHDRKPRDRIH